MNNGAISPASKKLNWIPMPDPIREEEVKIQLSWTADSRTELAIKRQANLMGFETTSGYITQMIARALASNDGEIVITRDGRLVHKNPPNMNPADNLKLTKRNAVAATVVGLTPEKFLNGVPETVSYRCLRTMTTTMGTLKSI